MGTRSGLARGWMHWKGEVDKGQSQSQRLHSPAWPVRGVRRGHGDTIPRQTVALGSGCGSSGVRPI